MAEADTVVRADNPLDLTFSEAELEAHHEHITEFVEAQLDAAGIDRAVIGLSGGIDSTLTSHLAVEALGADALHGLVMPSEVNRDDNMSDAERIADELLGIEYDVIEINPLVDTVLDTYPEAAGDQMAVGNLRVRCRALLNYLVANHEDALVLGTGNRSEALVGYYTKYGDGAVDCHPIAPLYKQQVRQLADHVGVPDDLVEKTPSAEMWSGQTDAEEMGMDYDTLDSILALHIDGGVPKAATANHIGVPESAVEQVREMYEGSAHKRAMPPGPTPLY
ncbi:NAD+ synthase [Haloarcula amylovorans]|uniref:NAD+ synthase n=1 Tax=Haloarcula amylovorans TaxID=2562280 RepID=UPI00107652AA|nr:NAD+ synthase [Halomicroarcula amylolytica]